MGQTRPLFRSFHKFDYKWNKSLDGLLGIRTRGGSMIGADKSTELWRQPNINDY